MDRPGDIIVLAASAWRLRGPLAASSYGTLWRADEVLTGAPAALKLVNRAQMDAAPPGLRRHWRLGASAELAFLRLLRPWDGRHIVRLLDHGVHLDCPALALELLDGDLKSHLDAQQRRTGTRAVPPLRALDWTAQVNAALARVHGYGWRHLDLKPANLLIDTASGTLKLADFGTSRPQDVGGAGHDYAGTAGWQAPEQCTPWRDARYRTDARSDYFALGLLLYRLVTGVPLRYAAACADALRDRDRAGCGRALAGAAPVPLAPDDAALFLEHVRDIDAAARRAALDLLRALLAPAPVDRPAHALAISRLIGSARDAAGGFGAAGAWRAAA
jgi:serine/threonine protein kinase